MDALDHYLDQKAGGGDALDAYLAGPKKRTQAEWEASPEYARLKAKHEKTMGEVARLKSEGGPSVGELASDFGKGAATMLGNELNAGTFGLYRRGRDALMSRVAPDMLRDTQAAEADVNDSLHQMPYLVGDVIRGVGEAGGGGLMGPGLVATKIAAPATNAIANPLLRAGAQGAITGGVSGGTQAAVEGQGPVDVAKSAGFGAALGAGTGLATEGLTQAGNAIINSTGGKARQFIERYGGKVGPMTSGKGGAFDQELAGLQANDKGIGEAAQRSGQRIIEKTDQIHQQRVAEPYRAEKAAIDAGAGQKMVPIDDVHTALMKVYQSPRLTTGQRGAIRAEIDSLDERYLHPQLGMRLMTEEQLNDYKTMLNNLSRAGQAGTHTIPEAELGGVAALVRNKVNQGPYRDLNAKYAEGAEERSDVRRTLGLGPKESRNEAADATRVRNVIMRQTQDTVTGGASTMDLPQLRKNYPELERDLDLPELLAAKSSLNFHAGAPGHGGLISRLPPGLGLGASAAMAMSHAGAASALPLAAEFAARNAAPITGRLLYQPAQVAVKAGERLSNPVSRAAVAKGLENQELAKKLKRYLGIQP